MSNLHKEANPAPLGLLGFGMTTVLLNLHNAGLLPLSIVIVAMGIALGGLAQIIAGIRELCQGNTFAGTAFTAYGLFWWSLVLIWVNPFAEAGIEGASKIAMGYYLLLWGIFTFFMFIGTLKHNRATQVVFGSLTILFVLLAFLKEAFAIFRLWGIRGNRPCNPKNPLVLIALSRLKFRNVR